MADAEGRSDGYESDEGRRIIGDALGRSDLEAGVEESEEEEMVSARETLKACEDKARDKTCAPSTSGGESEADCRICLLTDKMSNLVAPCACDGSLRYCHYKCLKTWVKERRALSCEICGQSYLESYRARLAKTVAWAEKQEQMRRDAALAAQLTGGGSGEAILPASDRSSGRLWCRVLLLIMVTIGLLYIVLFLSKGTHFSFWTSLALVCRTPTKKGGFGVGWGYVATSAVAAPMAL
ncbi:unnamed protein product [Ostreobium quekettii]|uniref:RING-CH-type domain-containing protein n=1 Tax=Ostreobium quekettii TaxID=121088 RepID=A0A8S1JB01_9CHLO|nr:unnamed protein product [Ostreobium quekettii]